MTRFVGFCSLTVCVALGMAPNRACAAPIAAGTTTFANVAAIQDIELLPNTPFNMTGVSIPIPNLTAIGQFTIDRQLQPAVAADIPLSPTGSALFDGTNPLLGPFELGSGPSFGIGSYSGSITDVVQDTTDTTGDPASFISGTLNLAVTFGLKLPGAGVELFTQDPALFSGGITSLIAPPPGTLLTSSGPVTAFFADPSTGNDIPIAVSTNRRLLVIPEPSGMLMMIGAGVLGIIRRLM